MRSDRQRLLNKFATLRAFLRREARIDSDHLTASARSLAGQDKQKRTPRGIQNALCQSRSRQATKVQVLDNDGRIRIRVSLRGLKMKVFSLALDFQMRLRCTPRHLAATATALFAGAQAALLAAQGRLTGPKEARVRYRVPIAIGKKDFQTDIQTDSRTIVVRMRQIAYYLLYLAHNQRVPMPIRSLDQIARPGRAGQTPMHFDLDRTAQFGRNLEQAASGHKVDTQLAQLDTVPLIAALKAWKAPVLVTMSKKGFQRFVQPLSKTLDSGGRNVCAAATLEQGRQVVLAQKLARLRIVLLLALQHLVIQQARFVQARIQTAALIAVWVQAILIRSHSYTYSTLKVRVQHLFWAKATKAWRFIPPLKRAGFHA
jgi:hypothetical protein